MNVYPAEVEAVLGEVDGVGELAVFGLPDERWGQRVCVALVPSDPFRARRRHVELVEAVRARAEVRLAAYKRPKQYVLLDELPRTPTGKVQRNLIPDRLDPA